MATGEDDKYKALAHPLRRALLAEMTDSGGRTLSHFVRHTGASPSRIANHLRLMQRARLVRARQKGRGKVYNLEKEGLQEMLAFLKGLVE